MYCCQLEREHIWLTLLQAVSVNRQEECAHFHWNLHPQKLWPIIYSCSSNECLNSAFLVLLILHPRMNMLCAPQYILPVPWMHYSTFLLFLIWSCPQKHYSPLNAFILLPGHNSHVNCISTEAVSNSIETLCHHMVFGAMCFALWRYQCLFVSHLNQAPTVENISFQQGFPTSCGIQLFQNCRQLWQSLVDSFTEEHNKLTVSTCWGFFCMRVFVICVCLGFCSEPPVICTCHFHLKLAAFGAALVWLFCLSSFNSGAKATNKS